MSEHSWDSLIEWPDSFNSFESVSLTSLSTSREQKRRKLYTTGEVFFNNDAEVCVKIARPSRTGSLISATSDSRSDNSSSNFSPVVDSSLFQSLSSSRSSRTMSSLLIFEPQHLLKHKRQRLMRMCRLAARIFSLRKNAANRLRPGPSATNEQSWEDSISFGRLEWGDNGLPESKPPKKFRLFNREQQNIEQAFEDEEA